MDAFPPLSRRQVLLGATGGLLLAACGGGGDDQAGLVDSDADPDAETSSSTTPGEAGAAGGLVLLVPPEQPVGADLRLPLGLASADGSFDVDLPASLDVRLRRPDGGTLPAMTVDHHGEGLPRGYFPLRATFDEPGRWGIVAETGTGQVETTVDARPPSEIPAVPGRGDALPNIPTPTHKASLGVDPICTNDPVCPFHRRSLDELIGGGDPIVLLVSTPAFCQVAICGPVLDVLIQRRRQLEAAGVAVIHAEVYVDDRARVTTPTVDALGLTYEPALFFAAPDGTVNARLDAIFDGVEFDEALARLLP